MKLSLNGSSLSITHIVKGDVLGTITHLSVLMSVQKPCDCVDQGDSGWPLIQTGVPGEDGTESWPSGL